MFPQKGCHGNLVYFCDLEKHGGAIEGKLPLTQIVFEFEHDFQYITTTGTRAIFRLEGVFKQSILQVVVHVTK